MVQLLPTATTKKWIVIISIVYKAQAHHYFLCWLIWWNIPKLIIFNKIGLQQPKVISLNCIFCQKVGKLNIKILNRWNKQPIFNFKKMNKNISGIFA